MNVKKDKNQKKTMQTKRLDLSVRSMIILIVISVFAIAVIYVFTKIDKEGIERVVLSDNAVVSINGEKEMHCSISDVIKKRIVHKGDKVTINMEISDKIDILNPVIMFAVPNSNTKVFYDGKEVYSISSRGGRDDVVGTERIKVPINEHCENKKIKFVVDVADVSSFELLYKIYLMNSYDADVFLIRSQVVNICISNFMYIFGIVCLLFNFGGFWKHHESKREIYIALTSIFGAMWIITVSSIGTYYGINAKYCYYIEYEALYVTLWLTMKLFYMRMKEIKQRKILKFFEYLMLGYIVVSNVLRIFRICYFKDTLRIMHCILLLCAVAYYYASIRNRKKYMEMFVIYSAMFVGVGLYVLLYNFRIGGFWQEFDVGSLTIFMLGIYMFVSLINEIKQAFMDKYEKEALEDKVYEDKLTMINNRRACERHMKYIDDTKEGKYLIYSFDINGLKKLNDNYGHEKGDVLIMSFASILKKVFCDEENDFIGRMGGDEFLAIQKISQDEEECIDISNSKKIIMINEMVMDENNSGKNDFLISYAVGIDVCDCTAGDKSWDIYNLADKEMYTNKKNMKEKNNSN